MSDLVPLQMLAGGLIFVWSGLVRSGIGFGGAAVAIDGTKGILHTGGGSGLTGSIFARPCTGDLLTPCSTCESARADPPIIPLSLSPGLQPDPDRLSGYLDTRP